MVLALLFIVLYGLVPCTALTDRFCMTEVESFTARYALSTYIKQISFDFKMLMIISVHLT